MEKKVEFKEKMFVMKMAQQMAEFGERQRENRLKEIEVRAIEIYGKMMKALED